MASNLRSIFFGTPEFAAHILRELIAHGEQIVAVVTTPPKPSGRGMKMHASDVQQAANELGIPVLTPTKHRDPEFLAQLKAFDADVFVVVAYKILPEEVFTMPRFGTFNIHASLLPKFRGAAPINWAIMRGEQETGITTFLLQKKVDTGNILLAKSIPIGQDETAGELHDRLMLLGAELALETLQGLASDTLHPMPQPSDRATDAPKIFPQDCIVNFNQPRERVHNFIRGLSPYPGAVMEAHEHRLKLLRSRMASEIPTGIPAGMIHSSEDRKRLFIGTETEAIEILELQREGKRAMSAEEFLRGAIWLTNR
ncbi:MAG TPA: methionyl-tRNA formyltransferase [Candidatus Kapabacteria bacterium]|jgi:methionyl-tRNA formyltransferase